MTSSLSTTSEGPKSEETEDGVVANETLVISPVPSRQSDIAVQEKAGSVVVGKETGPPDGGYGWVVVMYVQ